MILGLQVLSGGHCRDMGDSDVRQRAGRSRRAGRPGFDLARGRQAWPWHSSSSSQPKTAGEP